jgi:serine/threonine-protein kinase
VVVLLLIVLIWPSGDEAQDELGPAEEAEQAVAVPSPEEAEETAPAAEETAPVKAPARPAMARLQVITDPTGCKVKLDGLDLSGGTPLNNVIVPAGMDHEVVVSCAGFEVESRTVTPQADQVVALEFYPPAAGNRGKRYGRLQLFTRPRAAVYLGKRKLGVTPIKGLKLPAGTHWIRLVNKRARINKKLEIAIEPGKTTRLRPKL